MLECAVRGDEGAFRELTDPFRRELQMHCYRILGSMQDAEDALQETMLNAWRGLAGYQGRASLRSWLYRIATNRSLDMLRDAGRRPPPPKDPPFVPPEPTRRCEPTWLEPYPDVLLEGIVDHAPGPEARYQSREMIQLAFIKALQQLPPRQRATLILRDVLGFRAAEVAEMLESSEDSVKAALKRARASMERDLPSPEADKAPEVDSPLERELVGRFVEAWEADDMDAIVGLLTEDAWISMPPSDLEYQGREPISRFLRTASIWRAGRPYRLVATRANTQPAYGVYRTDRFSPIARATGLLVLTLQGERISAITHFLDPGALARFGLPRTLRD
jgi:RNA polymerase sigma-70 factor (ECF subfamily)